MQSVKVENTTIPTEVGQIVYDSGASLSYVPHQEFQILIRRISKDKVCWSIDNTDVICSCPNKEADIATFPTIYFDLGNLVL